ncbi:MAG: formate/nitrite transporter family protein [Nitrococcus sp.]|nr:formate/nitrite transporter family protein [Nitrococcus sp.]
MSDFKKSRRGGNPTQGENPSATGSSGNPIGGNPSAVTAGNVPAAPPIYHVIETVPPSQMGQALAADAAAKAKFAAWHLLVRGFLCTPFLAYGASVVFSMVGAGIPLGAAGLLFPLGYVTLSFLGLEMATGSFATMPIGMYAGTVTPLQVLRNWAWTLLGNLLGGIWFGWLLWFAMTQGGNIPIPETSLLHVCAVTAEHKVAYQQYGAIGWCAAIGGGVLCNWLVSLGSVMSKSTRSTIGRAVLMWIPVGTFFALGFEHTVVNMWLFPTGILSGADVTLYQWWVWNQIPVTIGNILGAMTLNGTMWYFTHQLHP